MIEWVSANLGTIFVLCVVALIVVLVIVSMRRDRKKGKSSCGCGCSSCPMGESCHKRDKDA